MAISRLLLHDRTSGWLQAINSLHLEAPLPRSMATELSSMPSCYMPVANYGQLVTPAIQPDSGGAVSLAPLGRQQVEEGLQDDVPGRILRRDEQVKLQGGNHTPRGRDQGGAAPRTRSGNLPPKGRVVCRAFRFLRAYPRGLPLSCLDDVSEAAMQLQHDDAACLYMNRHRGG